MTIMPVPRMGPETALNAVRLLPVVLVLAILAAHFYRAQAWVPFGVTVGLAPLLLVRAPWAARVLQAALALGALEWLRTAAALVALRQSMGHGWSRGQVYSTGFVVAGLAFLAYGWWGQRRAVTAVE